MSCDCIKQCGGTRNGDHYKSPEEIRQQRWGRLTDEQLQGAEFAYRLLRTSVRIRGAALELLDGLLGEVYDEMAERPGLRREQ